MASVFGHALTAIVIGNSYSKKYRSVKFWLLGVGCAILPDADVIGFKLGVAYESFWGHRGFSHSLLFALFIGILITFLFYRKTILTKKGILYLLFFTLCTASHAVLDALTNGGMGVAFFSPFNTTRYFFPWRPILVSPLGIENFFSDWGQKVILSEFIFIGVPSIIFILFTNTIKKHTSSGK